MTTTQMKETQEMKNTSRQNISDFTHDELLQALYFIWDAFDRAAMPFFARGKTADSILANLDLEGNTIEIGVKLSEWLGGAKRVLIAFVEPVTETTDTAIFEYREPNSPRPAIPIICHILKDDPCIVDLNPIMYRHERFNIPNPYKRFIELYG